MIIPKGTGIKVAKWLNVLTHMIENTTEIISKKVLNT